MLGKTVSHYKILEKLGEGGMGIVYKAEDTKLKRTVALKFLPPGLTRDPRAKERFLHEAQAAAALEHQNICHIYEIDESENQIFIAMSCFEGQTLKEKIDAGPLKIDEALRIAVQAAEGLQAAHEKGIVHRDIKSDNIMITCKGQAKIMDFGLAKLKGQSKITKEGSTLGTACYMSPEQAQGADVDHRTDIWSLGVGLYEMITGQLPFSGEYEQALVYSIINEEPEPLTALRTGVPMELERIVNKTLAKDPAERYQHADDLIVDLRKLKRETAPLSTAVAAPKKSSKQPFIILALAAAALIAAGGYFLFKGEPGTKKTVIKSGESTETGWKKSIAVLPFDDLSPAGDQEYFCDGMTDDIIARLSRVRELKVISRTAVKRYRNTAKDPKDIGKELGVAAILEGSIRKEKNNIRVNAQLIDVGNGFHLWSDIYNRKLLSVFDVQDEVSTAIVKALKLELSPGTQQPYDSGRTKNIKIYENCLRAIHILDSRYIFSKREKDFQAAIGMIEKALEIDPNYGFAHMCLVEAYAFRYNTTGSKEDFEKLISAAKKNYRLTPDSMKANGLMGWIHYLQGNHETALLYLKRMRKVSPHISDSRIMTAVGAILRDRGLYRQAVKYLSRAAAIDPFYFYTRNRLLTCFMRLGEYEKAVIHMEKALEISSGYDYPVYGGPALLTRMKKYRQAEQALAGVEKLDPGYSRLNYYKALLQAAKGEKEKALALYKKEDWPGLHIFSLLGMKAEAVRTLNQLEEKDFEFHYLELINEPFFDHLRDEPRFKEIVEKARRVYEERLEKYRDTFL